MQIISPRIDGIQYRLGGYPSAISSLQIYTSGSLCFKFHIFFFLCVFVGGWVGVFFWCGGGGGVLLVAVI